MTTPYRQHPSLSQSLLKNIWNPVYFKFLSENPQQGTSDSKEFGDLVDCLVLTPEDFDTRFIVSEDTLPTGQMLTFCDFFHKYKLEGYHESEALAKAYKEALFKRDSLEKVLERFEKEGKLYVEFLVKSEGKKVVSKEDYRKALNCISALKSDYVANKFLFEKEEFLPVETYFQKDLYANIDGVDCKGLLDLLYINRQAKRAYVVDLKTTAFTALSTLIMRDLASFYSSRYSGFLAEVIKYDYLFQQAFYSVLLYKNRELFNLTEDYEFFNIIIAVNSFGNSACVYDITDVVMDEGLQKVKKAIELYIWHTANGFHITPQHINGIYKV